MRRLIADAELMRTTFAKHPHIHIEAAEGKPPEKYRIVLKVNSLARDKKGRPEPREDHVAEVQLVDKDGDIIASAGERVFTKTPGKGLYIAFKYNILEVEVESSNESL